MDILKGRTVPPRELFDYTFPLSKIPVRYALLSQFTLGHIELQVQKKFPTPHPPMFTFDTDDGPRTEPNPADATYQQALADHRIETIFKVIDGMIELGVEVEVDQDRVDEYKRVMNLLGTPLSEISDKVLYIKHCCAMNGTEVVALANYMKGVTEEAIQSKQETFPGAVQAEGDQPVSSAIIGALV